MISVRVINQTRRTVLAGKARIADTALSRVVGLLRHTHLAPGTGLIITPCNSIHSIGMKFIFDAVFLDRDDRVVHLIENMKPWRLSKMVWSAHSVLELPGGVINQTGTCCGDVIAREKIDF